MSKTNETSKLATLDDHRPLTDSELAAVAGGARAKEMDTPAAVIAAAIVKALMP
jgi:hypothetical protein